MLLFDEIPQPLIFYDNLEKQDRFKENHEKYIFSLLVEYDRLLPFQFEFVQTETLTGLAVYNLDGQEVVKLSIAQMEHVYEDTFNYYTWKANSVMKTSSNQNLSLACGKYYLQATTTQKTYFSETFTAIDNVDDFLILEWANNTNLGPFYYGNGYRNRLITDTFITKGTPEVIIESEEDGFGNLIDTFKKYDVTYDIDFSIVPNFLYEVISFMSIHNDITVKTAEDIRHGYIKNVIVEADQLPEEIPYWDVKINFKQDQFFFNTSSGGGDGRGGGIYRFADLLDVIKPLKSNRFLFWNGYTVETIDVDPTDGTLQGVTEKGPATDRIITVRGVRVQQLLGLPNGPPEVADRKPDETYMFINRDGTDYMPSDDVMSLEDLQNVAPYIPVNSMLFKGLDGIWRGAEMPDISILATKDWVTQGFVALATNQTITGAKHFSGAIGLPSSEPSIEQRVGGVTYIYSEGDGHGATPMPYYGSLEEIQNVADIIDVNKFLFKGADGIWVGVDVTVPDLSGYALKSWVTTGFAAKDGTGAAGTWGIDISGSANRATYWNNNVYLPVAYPDPPAYVMAFDGTEWRPSTPTSIRSFLGMPSGGDTFQSVTNRGQYTSNSIEIGGVSHLHQHINWMDATSSDAYLRVIPDTRQLTFTNGNFANPNWDVVSFRTGYIYAERHIYSVRSVNYGVGNTGDFFNEYSGTKDLRSANQRPKVLSFHTGLSFSAHDAYQGTRIWSQIGASPYGHDGFLIAQFTSGEVLINTKLQAPYFRSTQALGIPYGAPPVHLREPGVTYIYAI